jgi:Skp family chaperone for outer membrane proteins
MHELAGLYEKDQPSDTEKKRIAELEAIGDSRKGEMSRLENTASPTDVQRKRFTELNSMHQQGEQNLAALTQDFESRLRTREDDLTKKALATIREAIAVVAKQKGLAVVFDSKFALYAQVDITADVAKQVNK